MIRRRLLATACAAAGLLSACTAMPPKVDAPNLDGTAWVLASLPARTLLEGTTTTLQFVDGRASGSDGCNRYTTPYTATGAALTFERSASATMMACPPQVMEQARAFSTSLGATRSFRLVDGALQLLGDDATVVASFLPQPQELAGTSWRVIGYNNGRQAVVSVLAGTQLTMSFAADGRVGGSAGCNNYSGSYTHAGSSLRFGPAAATRRMCADPEGILEQEQLFLQALETVTTIRQEGDRAELRTAEGVLAISIVRDADR